MTTGAWKDAWTGGQYSLIRAVVSVLLAWLLVVSTFAAGDVWWFPASLVIGTLALAVGAGGRALATVLASLLPFGVLWGTDSATFSIAGTWLFLHMLLPLAPYGSLAASGRTDPAGSWQMPRWYPAAWQAVFVITRMTGGFTAVMHGQQYVGAMLVAAGVLGLMKPAALAGWILSFIVELGMSLGGDGSTMAAVLLHLLTFQPAWIARSERTEPGHVFYDGSCALCHSAVRFLLSEDVDPPRFRVAPLEGPTFTKRVPESVRVWRPDSIVVCLDGRVLMRGAAAIAILENLGGLWWVIARTLDVLPPSLVDAAYDFVATRRYRWFGRRNESCPLMTPSQRERVDA